MLPKLRLDEKGYLIAPRDIRKIAKMYCSRERQMEQMGRKSYTLPSGKFSVIILSSPLLTHLFSGELDKTLKRCGEHNFTLIIMVYQFQADNL